MGGVGRASGKLILFGEHAAVYGFPAVGVSLPEKITVRLWADGAADWDLRDIAGRDRAAIRRILALMEGLLPELSSLSRCKVSVMSEVPRGLGFGSSAALCAALARAALAHCGAPPRAEEFAGSGAPQSREGMGACPPRGEIVPRHPLGNRHGALSSGRSLCSPAAARCLAGIRAPLRCSPAPGGSRGAPGRVVRRARGKARRADAGRTSGNPRCDTGSWGECRRSPQGPGRAGSRQRRRHRTACRQGHGAPPSPGARQPVAGQAAGSRKKSRRPWRQVERCGRRGCVLPGCRGCCRGAQRVASSLAEEASRGGIRLAAPVRLLMTS